MPLSAEDKIEIQELETRYYLGVDRHDPNLWVGAFTADARFESPFGNATGADELRQFIVDFHQYAAGNRHVATNHLSEEDGDGARSTSYFLIVTADKHAAVAASGEYESRLRKEGGRWKYSHRVLKLDPSFQIPAEMQG